MSGLIGIINEGTSAVITVEKNGEAYLIAIAISPKSNVQRKNLEGTLREKITKPDNVVRSDDVSISELFQDRAEDALSIS